MANTVLAATTVLATVVIAVFTVALFFLQRRQHKHGRKVTQANYKLALHERRMEVFNAIEDMLDEFCREREPSPDATLRLRHATRNAEFVFPDAPLQFIREIIDKSHRYEILLTVLQNPRNGIAPTQEDAARMQAQDEMETIKNWYFDQVQDNRLKNDFSPHLQLPESV